MRILIFLGTRPEVVKLAPIIHKLKEDDSFEVYVCITGQHKEMVAQMLVDFEISPDIYLDIMKSNQTLAELSSKLFKEIDRVLGMVVPDWVIVQGDTTSAFIASVVAYYKKVKVAHVEAGLRSHNFWIPFPEEFNRRAISLVSSIHFAPTEIAKTNLISEGVDGSKIIVTGNTVVDALIWISNKVITSPPKTNKILNSLISEKRKYILITCHRRESFGEGLKNICLAISTLAKRYPDIFFVYPVHLNPNVRGPVYSLLKQINNVILLDPLDYKSFVWAMANCLLILTDSGGIQEEAPTLGKYVLVMREVTEREEGVKAGTSILVGTTFEGIVKSAVEFIDKVLSGELFTIQVNPFGDGKAAERICKFFKEKINR